MIQNSNENLNSALKSLEEFNFDEITGDKTKIEDLESAWERYFVGLLNHRGCTQLSEAEEEYERSRWFRSQAMLRQLDQFKTLIRLCHQFFFKLTESKKQTHLGLRAELEQAKRDQFPSPKVQFKRILLPESPPLSIYEYESILGGPHVFGARLLWWCAAAATPKEFGYTPGFSQELWTQPFWFCEDANKVCRPRSRSIQLIQQAAEYACEAKSHPEKVTEQTQPAPPNGPDPRGVFYWDGREIKLQPLQKRLMKYLWPRRLRPVPIVDAIDEVWGGREIDDNTVWSNTSRLSTIFAEEGVPIELSYRESHLIVEVTDTSS